MEHKRLNVLGEVSKRFVVSPDVDTLLYAMELADHADMMAKTGVPMPADPSDNMS